MISKLFGNAKASGPDAIRDRPFPQPLLSTTRVGMPFAEPSIKLSYPFMICMTYSSDADSETFHAYSGYSDIMFFLHPNRVNNENIISIKLTFIVLPIAFLLFKARPMPCSYSGRVVELVIPKPVKLGIIVS